MWGFKLPKKRLGGLKSLNWESRLKNALSLNKNMNDMLAKWNISKNSSWKVNVCDWKFSPHTSIFQLLFLLIFHYEQSRY